MSDASYSVVKIPFIPVYRLFPQKSILETPNLFRAVSKCNVAVKALQVITMQYTAFCSHRIFENNGITLVFAFVDIDGNCVLVEKTKWIIFSSYTSILHRSIKIHSINQQSFFRTFQNIMKALYRHLSPIIVNFAF